MLNKLWASFFLIALLGVVYQCLFLGHFEVVNEVISQTFAMAKLSAEIALGLIGMLCLWQGLFKVGEASGLVMLLAKGLDPLFRVLMPEVPKNHPAQGAITMNLAANMLGLDNAATPLGIKAMQQLQQLNPNPATATNAQILFLVLNTSSVTLVPVTIFLYRAQLGAVAPAEVFLPILLATSASTLVGLLVVAWVQRINLIQPIVLIYAGIFSTLFALLLWVFVSLPNAQLGQKSALLGNGIILGLIMTFILVGWYRGIAVYESFISGAQEGFKTAIMIIPYLVAMLVAIGVLRASGALDVIISLLAQLFNLWHLDTRFVEALPTALLKPLSGSGARAMMLETMNTYGVDSFVGRLAAVLQGSTETTFYVLTVYFGAVGIVRVRHAVWCALAADAAGILTAIVMAYLFFG